MITDLKINEKGELEGKVETPQWDEMYTKDEVIAILTELQTEIDEKATELCDDGWWLTYNNLIQQKINSLKGEDEKC